jgi:predicted chitinase
MQVEKFDISQMQNTKEKWLEYLGILGEPVKYEITQEQLEEIFPNTDTTRLKEVMAAINNNCGDFNINTTQRMSHFLGQIGTETGGMKALNENECYSEASIKSVFGKVKRNGNRKYCDLFEGYNGTSLSTCPGNTLCECNPVLPDSISLDSLTVKDKYICKSALFDYTYACRMGNGAPSTKDGSKFKGKGFIQLTGKNKYKQISDEWNKMYPDDPKEFHGKDIDLLTTDIEIAMKASMVCWKIQDLNDWADVGMTDKAIDKVGSIVNGSGSNKPNGYDHRRSYTKKANEVLSK